MTTAENMRKHPQIPAPPPPDEPAVQGITQHALNQLRDVQIELAERRIEALRLYVPMPKQEEFHKCMASERLLIGGNRCLAGDQKIYDPLTQKHRTVSEINSGFWVEALCKGEVVGGQATAPFVKGWGDLYAFRLSNGGEIRCTRDHLVLAASGQWKSIWSLLTPEFAASLPRSTEGIFLQVSPEGDLRLSRTVGGSRAYYRKDRRSCDELLQTATKAVQGHVRKRSDALAHSRCCCSLGDLAHTEECIRPCPLCGHPSSKDVPRHFSAPGGASESQDACKPYSQPLNSRPSVHLSEPLFCAQPHTTFLTAQPASRSYCDDPCNAPSGGNEHVYITSCEYLGQGEIWDIEVFGYHNYLIAGVPNHNSGKSAASFIEDARAATGQDPYGKYPKEGGNLVIVGRNWPHIGLVVVPMLFRAGAFKMIKDETTGQWRAFRPGQDDVSKAKPAPPLIPPRMIKDMSWVLKNASYLNKCELTNGWTINCFSSEGEPPQGFQADLVHIDEDINNERWVGEMQARLADRKGRFVWSAMPHSQNDALLGLCERADKAEEEGRENPIIKKFTLRFLDNAHIDQEEKKKNIERWSALGMDELRMRAEGEFTTESTLMYPTFNPAVHVLRREDLPAGQVPSDWTKYVAIDPGHTVLACIFGAVPPDEKFLLIYDELYIRQANSLIFGEQFAQKADGQHYYNFIMDMHGGMLRDLGSGRLPHELYSEELKKRNIRAQISGFGFMPGSDDIPARTALVRQMLHVRGDGTTRLKFLEGTCPNLMREIRRYRKKTTTVNGQIYVTDEPQSRGEVHACQCVEYLCAYEPKYHPPPKTYGPDPWWVKYLADKRRRSQSSEDNCIILGPMGSRR